MANVAQKQKNWTSIEVLGAQLPMSAPAPSSPLSGVGGSGDPKKRAHFFPRAHFYCYSSNSKGKSFLEDHLAPLPHLFFQFADSGTIPDSEKNFRSHLTSAKAKIRHGFAETFFYTEVI